MLEWFEMLRTREGIEQVFERFSDLGIFVGFILVFLESFLPFLPLFMIVVLNINAYGFVLGFSVSYIAAVSSNFIVFVLLRTLFQKRAKKYLNKHHKANQLLELVNTKGFSFLFIMLSLPFTPSALMNLLAALSNMKKEVYLFVLTGAKCFMILSMSIIGYDIVGFFTSPLRMVLSILFLVVIYFISKAYQKYIELKV